MTKDEARQARREAALRGVKAAREAAEARRLELLGAKAAELAAKAKQAQQRAKAKHREEPMTEEQRLAARRLEGQLRRVRQGKTSPAVALALLETIAPAIPVAVYDSAADAIEQAAVERGVSLEIRPSWVARIRPLRDGLDAATRQARRREVHQKTTGKGAMPTAGIEADNAANVTAAMPWRSGELRNHRELCGPVVALRPVWAVDSSGVADDAANVFGIALEGSLHSVYSPVGEGTYFGGFGHPERWEDEEVTDWMHCDCQPTAKQAAKAAARGVAWRCEVKRHRIREGAIGGNARVQVVTDRRQWAVARDLGPASPWRVPDLGCDSPLLAVAAQVRAAAHDARLAELERRERYQRNGWVHGEAVVELAPSDVISEQPHWPAAPVCLSCRRHHPAELECAVTTA